MMLFSDLEKWAERTALYLSDTQLISYQTLADMADEFSFRFRDKRNLVFLIGANNLATVVAYVAAVRSKQPILLLNDGDTKKNEMLISCFRPSMVVRAWVVDNEPEYEVDYLDSYQELHENLTLLLATSGTTGAPKLVKLSAQNIYKNTQSIKQYLSITPSDIALLSLNMSYSFGLSVLNTHLDAGAGLVLTNDSVVNDEVWALMSEKSITSFYGVPYTYELLDRLDYDFEKISSIRYFAQAGGKLTPALIRKFSSKLAKIGAEFYVMYGQTEASPRISYLPTRYVYEFPECIGIAIPGGQLEIIDENGMFISESGKSGELVYKGPNVMAGYAYTGKDLAIQETIEWLKTGDIACFNEQGLFQIIGRTARFVKPFGVRICLDSIQDVVSHSGYLCAVAGNDDEIVVALEFSSVQMFDDSALLAILESETKLPARIFHITLLEKIPTLASGKIDYKSIACLINKPKRSRKIIPVFFDYFVEGVTKYIGVEPNQWRSITDIYQHHFLMKLVDSDSTFKSLAGDSLTYVELSMDLEAYIGHLPENWHELSLETLEHEHGFKASI